jgi:hypothetical protein
MASDIKATREGLPGQKTASGWTINNSVPFVALPSHAALRQWVRITNQAVVDAGVPRSIKALVLDVGPWNENDDAYVFGGARPQAETGVDGFGRKTNGAGIDLGEAVWQALGMQDNSVVSWEFV